MIWLLVRCNEGRCSEAEVRRLGIASRLECSVNAILRSRSFSMLLSTKHHVSGFTPLPPFWWRAPATRLRGDTLFTSSPRRRSKTGWPAWMRRWLHSRPAASVSLKFACVSGEADEEEEG